MTNKKTWTKLGGLIAMMTVMGLGCEKTPIEEEGDLSQTESASVSSASSTSGSGSGGWTSSGTSSGTSGGTTGTTSSQGATGIPGSIKWLGTDVSGWPVTASLSARVGGGAINMPYSKSRVWPAMDGVNANPWAIVNINGQWYGGTFEYLRHGQTSKPVGVLDGSKGDHFKASPLSSWTPRSGERFGLMVSGLARGGLHNVKERSNISMVTWP